MPYHYETPQFSFQCAYFKKYRSNFSRLIYHIKLPLLYEYENHPKYHKKLPRLNHQHYYIKLVPLCHIELVQPNFIKPIPNPASTREDTAPTSRRK